MTPLPAWAHAIRADTPLTREVGLVWLSEPDREARRGAWIETWRAVPFDDAFHAENERRLARCVPVFEGPSRTRRVSKQTSTMALVFDPEEPDAAWVSLSHAMPPLTWGRAATSAEGLRRSLAPYLAPEAPSVHALPRSFRAMLTDPVARRGTIEQAVEGLELWIDDAKWSSAFDDDPWRDVPPDVGRDELAASLREAAEEHPGRFPSVAFRSLWSRGVLKIEQHPFGAWVFELRYAPAHDGPVVERLGDQLGFTPPGDLPVDLLASLLRGTFVTAAAVAEARGREPDAPHVAQASCALWPGEATTSAVLARAAEANAADFQAQATVTELALAYGHYGLAFDIALSTEHEEIRSFLEDRLRPQAPGEGGDEDDEDDEDEPERGAGEEEDA